MPLTLFLQSFTRPDTSSIAKRVSTAADGGQIDGTYNPAISTDGRYLLFGSRDTSLAAGDTAGRAHIFYKDLVNGAVLHVSTGSSGAIANADSDNACFSADGRYAVFASNATNLTGATDGNDSWDIFRKNLTTGEITRVSENVSGVLANGGASNPDVSADGRYVVFASLSTNLVPDSDANLWDIFRKDLETGEVHRVTQTGNGVQANGFSSNAKVSADGRYVFFSSYASNLVTNDTNAAGDIFRKDLLSGTVIRVSTGASGIEANKGVEANYSLSADGRYMVFSSSSANLVAGDTNGRADIFRKDLTTGEIVLVSTAANGAQANKTSSDPVISADGRYVVFRSDASNLAPGDVDPEPALPSNDFFRKDLVTGEVVRIPGAASSTGAAFSPDGRYVYLSSHSSDWGPGDTNGAPDIFQVDAARMHEWPILSQGLHVQVKFGTGAASSASIAWGDGAVDHVQPASGSASFGHTYAATGIKQAAVTVREGSQSWTVPYLINLSSGQMSRDTALADTLSGGKGKDRLNGDGFSNKIIGNAGSDTIKGDYGNDTLWGGYGNDKLYGGKGRDSFVFDAKLGTDKTDRKKNFDKIYDFNVKDDALWLDNKIFKKLGKKGSETSPAKLNKKFFKIGTEAKDKNDYLVYDRKTGVLSYDKDGSGAAKAVEFAKLDKKLKLTYKDFFVI